MGKYYCCGNIAAPKHVSIVLPKDAPRPSTEIDIYTGLGYVYQGASECYSDVVYDFEYDPGCIPGWQDIGLEIDAENAEDAVDKYHFEIGKPSLLASQSQLRLSVAKAVAAATEADAIAHLLQRGLIDSTKALMLYSKAYGAWDAMCNLAAELSDNLKMRVRRYIPIPCDPAYLLDNFGCPDTEHDPDDLSAIDQLLEGDDL